MNLLNDEGAWYPGTAVSCSFLHLFTQLFKTRRGTIDCSKNKATSIIFWSLDCHFIFLWRGALNLKLAVKNSKEVMIILRTKSFVMSKN